MDITPLRRVYWIPPVVPLKQKFPSYGIICQDGFIFKGFCKTVHILIEHCCKFNKDYYPLEQLELQIKYITETQPIEMCELLTHYDERIRELAIKQNHERSRLQSMVRQR